MRLKVKDWSDLLSGLLFLAVGIGAFVIALDYAVGTASRMGAGYLPRALSAALAVLGAIITVRALTLKPERVDTEGVGAIAWRPLIMIVLALALFGWLLPRYGMVVASLAVVFVGAMAGHEFRVIPTVILSMILTAMGVLIFVTLLGLPFRVWP